ncbi:MAG: glycosyltransferase [Acidimicrobiales bacterium]|nr:glycosyltransferase [Acidimicrobiales bacterium]
MRALLFVIPIGILGLIRWSSWLIRRVPAVLYRPYPEGHYEPITVVTPVYQEDPEIFRAAVASWLANRGVQEVICVVDTTDTTCIEIAKQLSMRSPVTLIVTDVPGKRDALRRGWEAAKTEIVALVDSDTIWADDVAARVVEPFVDPEVGGVGTRQNVLNPETLWQRINDFYLDSRYLDEVAGQTQWGQAVSCLSGRTAVYRRSLLLEISHDFMTETFMGVPCNSGEDKRLTMLTLRKGYKTWMQQNARVWSTFPRGARTFFRQRLRWARNTWRSDLRALRERWVFRHKWLAFSMLDKAVSSFTLLVAPVFMIFALVTRHFAIAGFLALWWLVSRGIKYLPHLQRRPLDVLLLPAFILVTFVVAGMKIVALLSIRRQRWLTRDVEVVDGKITRVVPGTSRPAPLAGTARRRWIAVGVVGAVSALVVGGAGFAQAQQALRGPTTKPFAPIAMQATTPSSTTASAPAPAAKTAPAGAPAASGGAVSGQQTTTTAKVAGSGTPAGTVACKKPDDPPERSEDNPLYTGTGTSRTLSPYSPFRLLQTKCAFPADFRAVALGVGQIRIRDGAKESSIAWPAGGVYRLEELARVLDRPDLVSEPKPGVIEVRAAIIQTENTTLTVNEPVTEVHLVDNPHVFIGGRKAVARFDGVRVTSQSRTAAEADTNYGDGRPFVLYEDGSTLDITDSFFSFLGSDRSSAYGVSWRTGGTNGTITDSTFSNNFFGMYSYEAANLTFIDNSFKDNVFYGVDPHDRSHNLTFRGNLFENNGSHGAIVSKEVSATTFRDNRSVGNGGNGFVIDSDSFDVVIEGNVAANNAIDGIVVLNSRRNEIINNEVRENRVGIRINGERSTGNIIEGNTVDSNVTGIQLYGGASATRIEGALVRNSEKIGISVDAPASQVVEVDVTGGLIGIDLRSPASVEGGAISQVGVGIAVRSPEPVSIKRVRINALEIGVRVDRLSTAALSESTVSAPVPYKGSEQIVRGADIEVRTLAPPGLHWFGVFGFAFLVAGLLLEAVRRVRNRGRSAGGNPPDIVRTNFA